jgi:hypothetical protein
VSVQAAPGFSYLMVEIVTSGNLLMHHLLIVRTHSEEESKFEENCDVF